MIEILSMDNHINLVEHLHDVSDAKNLLDITRQWLNSLSSQDPATVEMNQRATRFMLAIFLRMYDVPLFNILYDPDGYAFPATPLSQKLWFLKVRNISIWNELFLRSNSLNLPI